MKKIKLLEWQRISDEQEGKDLPVAIKNIFEQIIAKVNEVVKDYNESKKS